MAHCLANTQPARSNRRRFLKQASAVAVSAVGGSFAGGGRPRSAWAAARPPYIGRGDLIITRIIAQDAPGRRATPVAPNAFAEYRGYRVNEPLVRIQTNQGIEGVTRAFNIEERQQVLRQLIGKNPFELFQWDSDRYAGPAEEHRELVAELRSVDIALFDLLGKAMDRPVAELFASPVRQRIDVYDSTLYMDDLLTDEQRVGLAYLEGKAAPDDDAEMVARKAEWLVDRYYRDEGLRIFKIKTGRARWMDSYQSALQRDIDVFRRVRQAIGPHFTLLVDVNNGYDADYTAAKRFIEETSDEMLFGLEEMFQERMVEQHREVVQHAYSLGLRVRNIDGETPGIPPEVLEETVDTPRGVRPLFDINNPSFSHGLGFVQVWEIARHSRQLGVDIAPHNFASKIGFYASVHMGAVIPNWAFAEIDDSQFPGLRLNGIEVVNGRASLTGVAGLGIDLQPHSLEVPRLEID